MSPVFLLALCFFPVVTCKLLATQIFVRHGQRYPTQFARFPTEDDLPVQVNYEPGELTDIGVQQEYQLGKNLRDYYTELLGSSYRAAELKIVSGQDNRTVVSALALLQGLFPDRSSQHSSRSLAWKPIPVRTTPIIDMVSFGALDYCQGYVNEIVNGRESQAMFQGLNPLVQQLQNLTGIPIHDLDRFQKVVDSILTRYDIPDILPPPSWAWDTVLRKNLTGLRNTIHQFVVGRMPATGQWHFNEVVNEFDQILDNLTQHKFILYSGHDTNLLTLGLQLNISVINSTLQPVASYLAIDLIEDKTDHIIRVFLHNQLNGSRTQLNIDRCPEPCSYTEFRQLSQRTDTTMFTATCLGKEIQIGESRTTLYGIIASLAIVVLVLLASLMVMLFLSRRTWKRRYHRLAKEERRPLLGQQI